MSVELGKKWLKANISAHQKMTKGRKELEICFIHENMLLYQVSATSL